MGHRAFVLSAALLALDTVAVAQEPNQQDTAAADAMWKAYDRGAYLAAVEAARARAFDAQGKPRPGFGYDQWREAQGLVTGEPPAPIDDPGGPSDDSVAAQLAVATPVDAIAAIVARAKDARIVILNEDHAVPRDRAFGLAVARALRPLGYDLLAVETLSNDVSPAASAARMAALARDGYPRRGTGVYLRDPVFGDFLRQALALGYRPIAYENTDYAETLGPAASIARREQAQADNLVAQAIRPHPTSKLLVYVGFDHATENPAQIGDGTTARWLAARLKAQTGIDPLTIDQVTLNATGSGDRRLHAAVEDRLGGRSAVMTKAGKPLVVGRYAGLVDLQVAHPATRWIDGRPDWLAAMGRIATPVPAALLPKRGTRLVQAFIAGEAADAIPVDQVLVIAGAPAPKLLLPHVPVRYAVQDAPASREAPVARTPPAR